uniref:Uncharacterized protein n=1 Tax=Trichuris muris TaxID=70415 RepID=A0A5S6R4P5_TRIMR
MVDRPFKGAHAYLRISILRPSNCCALRQRNAVEPPAGRWCWRLLVCICALRFRYIPISAVLPFAKCCRWSINCMARAVPPPAQLSLHCRRRCDHRQHFETCAHSWTVRPDDKDDDDDDDDDDNDVQ